jgi:hypothetical protein
MHDVQNPTTSRTARLAAFFVAHPGVWFDGAGVIAEIGGRYAWRSRLAEARIRFGLDIRNRQRTVKRPDGSRIVVSEYALLDDRRGQLDLLQREATR